MADQKQQRAVRRLLENFEQRIGAIAVHLVGTINDDDAPSPFRRGQVQEMADLSYVLDHNLAA